MVLFIYQLEGMFPGGKNYAYIFEKKIFQHYLVLIINIYKALNKHFNFG